MPARRLTDQSKKEGTKKLMRKQSRKGKPSPKQLKDLKTTRNPKGGVTEIVITKPTDKGSPKLFP
jgi:hypothetical protein